MSENATAKRHQFAEAPLKYAGYGRPPMASKRHPISIRKPAPVPAPQKSGMARSRLVQRGDKDLQALLINMIPNLRAFATSLCRNSSQADDLVQDTLVKAWTNLSSFEKGTNFKAWLFTILRNTFFSDLRKRSREVQDADGVQAARLYDLPRQQVHMDFADFKKAFASLGDDQKEALLLVGAEGFSYLEAGEIAGVPVGTVKSRVNRARVALTKLLSLDAAENFSSNAEFYGLARPSPMMQPMTAQ